MSTTEIAPTIEVSYPSGIEIRYFAADKEAKVKRHYELRKCEHGTPTPEFELVPSVTEVQNLLKKEALISWAQRVGANGMIQLFNMGVLRPVQYGNQTVLGTHTTDKGVVVVGEEEALELIKRYRLSTDALKEAGGERGQSCHVALETWAKTGSFPAPATYPITEQGYVIALEHFLRQSRAIARRYEVVVGSAKYGYAGRFDMDIEIPQSVELQVHWTPAGRGDRSEWFEAGLYRIDLKTSKGIFEEQTEQLEAYEQAAIECELPETLARVVLNCNENGKYRFGRSWSTFADFQTTLEKWHTNELRKARKKEMA